MALGISVLGVGRIGRMHLDIIQQDFPDASVVSVYDSHQPSADAIGETHDVRIETSLDAALGASDVDAVAICSSTDAHVDMIVAAAEAGKHIFCEKPISLDLAEVDRALAAVADAGVALQIGFNRRFDPNHAAVQRAVADGSIGDVHLVRITSRDPEPPPIDYVKVSGGIFCDMTIHDFDMARYVVGSEVVEVFASGGVMVDPAIGEAGDLDTVVLVLKHENGAITTIDNSRLAVYGYDQRVEAFGSGGMVRSDNLHETTAEIATAAGYRRDPLQYFFLERYRQSFLSEWRAFLDAVTAGETPPVTGADGRAPLLLALAAKKSITEGRAVRVDEVA